MHCRRTGAKLNSRTGEQETPRQRPKAVSGRAEDQAQDGSDREEDTLEEEDPQDRVRELGTLERQGRSGQEVGELSAARRRERRKERRRLDGGGGGLGR